MCEKNEIDVANLVVWTAQELIQRRWKNCNIEMLKRLLEEYPIMIEHRRTHQRGIYSELKHTHESRVLDSGVFFWGMTRFERDYLFREADIEAFEKEFPDVAAVLRGEQQRARSTHAARKSRTDWKLIRQIVRRRLEEVKDHEEEVSYGALYENDPEIQAAFGKPKPHRTTFYRHCAGLREKYKSGPGMKKKQSIPSE
jgi:hypothetical protein